MAKASVKYQSKGKSNQAWSAGNTIVTLPDISLEAVKDFLLSRNPNWDDLRITEIKPM